MPTTVIDRIKEISMGEGCFICQHSNANWIAEIQDFLEEINIPVEQFAKESSKHAGKLFEVKNGRLRVIEISQCVKPEEVIHMIQQCYERI